jgi:hypothetical protein
VYKGHHEHDMITLHKTYGTIIRIAPNELLFSSLLATHDILALSHRFTKTEFCRILPPKYAPDTFTAIRVWKYSAMKRVAVVLCSLASVQKMALWIEDVYKELVNEIGNYADEAKVCDLGNLLHYFAFDAIREFAYLNGHQKQFPLHSQRNSFSDDRQKLAGMEFSGRFYSIYSEKP